MGRRTGIEPATTGATIQGSTKLSYLRHGTAQIHYTVTNNWYARQDSNLLPSA